MLSQWAQWVAQNGQDVLQAAGIIAGLAFTAHGLHTDTRSRQIQTLITLTEQHRDIWEEVSKHPALARIMDRHVDLRDRPITPEEARFVGFVILHIHCWFRAQLAGEVVPIEAFERDLRALFALPVAAHVWEQRRSYLDRDFVEFVDRALLSNDESPCPRNQDGR